MMQQSSSYLDFSDSKTIWDYIKPITNFLWLRSWYKIYTYIINYTKTEQKEFYKYLAKIFLILYFSLFLCYL